MIEDFYGFQHTPFTRDIPTDQLYPSMTLEETISTGKSSNETSSTRKGTTNAVSEYRISCCDEKEFDGAFPDCRFDGVPEIDGRIECSDVNPYIISMKFKLCGKPSRELIVRRSCMTDKQLCPHCFPPPIFCSPLLIQAKPPTHSHPRKYYATSPAEAYI